MLITYIMQSHFGRSNEIMIVIIKNYQCKHSILIIINNNKPIDLLPN